MASIFIGDSASSIGDSPIMACSFLGDSCIMACYFIGRQLQHIFNFIGDSPVMA